MEPRDRLYHVGARRHRGGQGAHLGADGGVDIGRGLRGGGAPPHGKEAGGAGPHRGGRRARAPGARYSAPATFAVLKTMEVLASTAGGAGSRASSRKRVRFWGAVWIDSARMVSPYSRAARRPAIAAGCGHLSRATRRAPPAGAAPRTRR